MDVSGDSRIPFEGFSLERSTSFSQEKDEFTAAQFEGHEIAGAPKNLRQKFTEQNYSGLIDEELIIRKKGSVAAIQDLAGRIFFPLERKPFVFEKEGKLNVVNHHIQEIKNATTKNP